MLQPVATLAGRGKPMLSRPGNRFDRPAYPGAISIPPTIAFTSRAWVAMKSSPPAGAEASKPAAAPKPVPHAIKNCDGLAGDLWKAAPGTGPEVYAFRSYWLALTTFCRRLRPVPLPDWLISWNFRAT